MYSENRPVTFMFKTLWHSTVDEWQRSVETTKVWRKTKREKSRISTNRAKIFLYDRSTKDLFQPIEKTSHNVTNRETFKVVSCPVMRSRSTSLSSQSGDTHGSRFSMDKNGYQDCGRPRNLRKVSTNLTIPTILRNSGLTSRNLRCSGVCPHSWPDLMNAKQTVTIMMEAIA